MKAIVQSRYGPPAKVLSLQDVERPTPAADEVLIRVRAASVHADTWHAVTGRPYIMRLMGAGLLRPACRIPGIDAAGTVEATGEAVSAFSPGDEVYGEIVRGMQWKNGGAYAEYATAPAEKLRPKPAKLSFEEAACVPSSGAIAVQVVREEAKVAPGERVLVNGAGGSVGSFAVQLAKSYGAHVTAVDHAHKLDLLRGLGADEVVDPMRTPVRALDDRFDVVIDVASTFTLRDIRRVVRPEGRYILVGHDHYGAGAGRWFGSITRFLRLAALAPFVDQLPGARFVEDPGDRLTHLGELIEAGEVRPALDRAFPLEEAVGALQVLMEGRALGKLVLVP